MNFSIWTAGAAEAKDGAKPLSAFPGRKDARP